MSQETLSMSSKERRRLVIMEQVESGGLTLTDAAARMRVSMRQAVRIRKGFVFWGAEALVHGSRGRESNRALPQEFKQKVLGVYKTHYREYGPTLASEVLEEEHDLSVHAETLRRWLHGACLYTSGRSHRQHRQRRERRRRFGQLVQIDGSHHRWLGPDTQPCCLMVAVDDATGRTMGHMAHEETTVAAYVLLCRWIARFGVPEAIYVDRRSIYTTDREPTAEEMRQGSGALTDFARACWRLGIEIILARSPEAKGRVERKNGVLQDRFVKFLARKGIVTIASANAVIDAFLRDLDHRQAKPPADSVDAHRKAPPKRQMLDICCRETQRSVASDWTVSYRGQRYQIERQTGQPAPRQRVTVRRRLDESIAIVFNGKPMRHRWIE